ncbi:MAG TPA: TolC family protein, partial [bacterium]|nr:TolC family protein [bacterium]
PLAAPDPGADALAVMAKIDLPLWFNANKARVQAAKLGLAQTQYQYADKRNAAESEVRTLHFKILQVQKSLELYDSQLIPEAEQTLTSAMAAYKTGSLGFLDLLDSERMILQFRLSYYKERATYFQHLADLEQAVGTELHFNGE